MSPRRVESQKVERGLRELRVVFPSFIHTVPSIIILPSSLPDMYAGEDDLELLEEYDLEHDSDDSRSDGERGVRDDAYEDEAHANTPEEVEAAINEVKGTVVEVVSALGGLEDVEVEGKIETVYVLGDDCLRECGHDARLNAYFLFTPSAPLHRDDRLPARPPPSLA